MFTYTIRLATQPPHPVKVFARPESEESYSDLERRSRALPAGSR